MTADQEAVFAPSASVPKPYQDLRDPWWLVCAGFHVFSQMRVHAAEFLHV